MKIRALAVVLALAATACGGATEPVASLSGTFNLASIGGVPMPVQLAVSADGTITSALASEQLVFNASGTYVRQGVTSTNDHGATTSTNYSVTGNYTRSGTVVRLVEDETNGFTQGTLAGSTLTISLASGDRVYASQ